MRLALARFIDVRFLDGDTADRDRPATMADVGRFALMVVGLAALGWLAARISTGWF